MLLETLAPYASQWRPIGLQLGFISAELDTIATPPGQRATVYLESMLSEWLRWSPKSRGKYATLDDLKIALYQQSVNLGTVAEKLDALGKLMSTFCECQIAFLLLRIHYRF